MNNYRVEKYTHPLSQEVTELIFLDNEDGSVISIPANPANSDYQAYLKSLEDAAN